jgi:outer membrane protein TolC
VHLAKIKLRVVSFSYNVAKKNYELVKHRYDSGLVSEFELLQAKVNMENFAPQVIEAESELERATNNLKVMLTMPLETALVFTDSLRVLDESVAFEEKDIWKRYDYLADQWRLKMYEKNQTIEYSYHLPYIDAALQYKYSGANNEFARNKKLEGETMNVGVTMSIPIFSGFRTQARYEQAVIDYHQATLRLAQKSDRMKMEYKNAKLRLEAARKRLIASKTSRESARKALEIASARKRVGSITELDFQNIQIQLETSERNYYRAIYDFNKAYIDLLKSVGKLDKLFSINDNGESDAQ